MEEDVLPVLDIIPIYQVGQHSAKMFKIGLDNHKYYQIRFMS